VEAHVQLGTALSRVPGATFEALSEFEEALRIAPDFRLAHVSMGLILARIPGRRAEAIAHLQTALTLGPDPRLQQVVDALESQTPR
jgi:tetratricopeptide (TPR) repeat protein